MSSEQINPEQLDQIKSWDELDISANLLRGIYSNGYDTLSYIQSVACKPIIAGKNIIAQAQSGMGKTTTYGIGALSHVDCSSSLNAVMILCPTRILAIQITGVLEKLGANMDGLRVKCLVGGSPVSQDVQYLTNTPPHIIVGTPGRMFDMINRNCIHTKDIKCVILDETDELLSTEFKDQIYKIFEHLSSNVQRVLMSATFPPHILLFIDKFIRDPIRITVKKEELTLEGIDQFYVVVDNDEQKYATLLDIYKRMNISQVVIYCNSSKRVNELHAAMASDNFPAKCIHKEMTLNEQTDTIDSLNLGETRALVSTDITSRGMDIQCMDLVINFDSTENKEKYLHRIGRVGRWGRKGKCINFVTEREEKWIKDISSYYNCEIKEFSEKNLV